QEFPGARGSLTVVQDQPDKGHACLKLSGDFTGGGQYVETFKDLKALDLGDLAGIQPKYKTDNASTIGLRLVDATGQCHQSHASIQADGKWHEILLATNSIVGGEHWGGANDGKWHGPAALFSLNIGANSDPAKTPVLYLADASAQVLAPVVASVPAFQS